MQIAFECVSDTNQKILWQSQCQGCNEKVKLYRLEMANSSHCQLKGRYSNVSCTGPCESRHSFTMKSTDFTNKIDIFGNRRNRQSVWQIVVQIYKEFSTQSTIHGIKYTTQAKSLIGRFLWFIVVCLSVAAASQLSNDFYERHKSGNMRTLVMSNQYPSWQLKLPAITLCHSDVASLHRLAPYLDSEKSLRMPFGTTMDDFRESLKYLSAGLVPTSRFVKELQVLERVLEINNMSLAELFHLVGPKCNEFIVMCKFEGKIKNCEKLISRSYTPYGLCCSFNYAHIQKEHRTTLFT